LWLYDNNITDISSLSGLTNLTELNLYFNALSDISAVSGLTNLTYLSLSRNTISDISAASGLTNLAYLWLYDNSISDLSPLVSNTGLGTGDIVDVSGNPLSDASINTHIPTLQGRGVEVQFDDISTTVLSYTSMIPAGISLFHVPLDVEGLDTVSDLKAMLGDSVSVASVYDTAAGSWNSRSDDVAITADLGIYLVMIAAKEITFEGQPWGGGSSMINLNAGTNFIGLPVNDPRVTNVSDIIGLFAPEVVASVLFSTLGKVVSVEAPGDDDDGPVMGDAAYIVMASVAGSATLSGDGWSNDAASAAPIALAGYPIDNQTPVLNVHGVVVDEITGRAREGFRVKVKNLSTKAALSRVTSVETAVRSPDSIGTGETRAGYNMTFVDLKAGHAAQVGDVLEITADSPNPLIGVNPVRHIVTVDDVKASRIWLEPLIAYEIPAETELLRNYPNPFNPETWIPYHLAHDAEVTLTIYDIKGAVVRRLNLGHQRAGYYTDRTKAVYWDGRNEWGETVASGVYFYHLSAEDYSATRRMVILK
ncbi:T9SS type A sorting domain-containing protein, partial [Candidatus Poribacteria bacterium]|nr:T9SS type A sorting domain-containing protein [Candidatus Poribacteria bacterium]